MSNKPLIVFHDHCTDGFGAAFAAWMKFKDKAEYLPMSYGDKRVVLHPDWLDFPANLTEREVYILDFSFSKEITEAIVRWADRVIWLDHHKTAFEMWCGKYEKGMFYMAVEEDKPNIKIYLDDNKSGAMLAWEYFHPDTEVPILIKHIDDRDRWQFKIPGSKELHAALASYKPWSFEQWRELNTQMNNWYDIAGPHYIFKEGAAILRAHEQNVQSIAGAGRRDASIKITVPQHGPEPVQLPDAANGYDRWFNGLAVNCPPYAASDVGHELANQSGTFGLCWYMGRDGKAKVSLRSNGQYDVSAIAKAFGGGGHLNASGMEVPMETLLSWLR